jgi:hypothetical protein
VSHTQLKKLDELKKAVERIIQTPTANFLVSDKLASSTVREILDINKDLPEGTSGDILRDFIGRLAFAFSRFARWIDYHHYDVEQKMSLTKAPRGSEGEDSSSDQAEELKKPSLDGSESDDSFRKPPKRSTSKHSVTILASANTTPPPQHSAKPPVVNPQSEKLRRSKDTLWKSSPSNSIAGSSSSVSSMSFGSPPPVPQIDLKSKTKRENEEHHHAEADTETEEDTTGLPSFKSSPSLARSISAPLSSPRRSGLASAQHIPREELTTASAGQTVAPSPAPVPVLTTPAVTTVVDTDPRTSSALRAPHSPAAVPLSHIVPPPDVQVPPRGLQQVVVAPATPVLTDQSTIGSGSDTEEADESDGDLTDVRIPLVTCCCYRRLTKTSFWTRQSEYICRICEERIQVRQLPEHDRYCVVVSQLDTDEGSCDIRLNHLLDALINAKLDYEKSDDCDPEVLRQVEEMQKLAANCADLSYDEASDTINRSNELISKIQDYVILSDAQITVVFARKFAALFEEKRGSLMEYQELLKSQPVEPESKKPTKKAKGFWGFLNLFKKGKEPGESVSPRGAIDSPRVSDSPRTPVFVPPRYPLPMCSLIF